jgi:hypothetical protein
VKLSKTIKQDLAEKFRKVVDAPEGFGLFEAIHDFIEEIELQPAFSADLSYRTKINRDLNIPTKYGYLRQIYQGLEDAHAKAGRDLGHARFTNVRDLNRIKNQDLSDNNFFWKKRALFRKLAGEVYERLNAEAS